MSQTMRLSHPSIQEGYTALAWACHHSHSNVVKILLHYGANVNQQNDVSKPIHTLDISSACASPCSSYYIDLLMLT